MLADPVHPLDDIEGLVHRVRDAGNRASRKTLVHDALAGQIDYGSPEGKAIGHRRALLCTRLREEELDDVFL
jgi:hypothetical protein